MEEEEGCTCTHYDYALAPTLAPDPTDKVFAIRRQGYLAGEELHLSMGQAYILACRKQASELLKYASARDCHALLRVMDTCEETNFEQLHTALKAFKLSPASSPPCEEEQLAVFEIVEVPFNGVVTPRDPMHYDAHRPVEGIVEEWLAKENTKQETKVYRVVCSNDCETPGNQLYGTKEEAYAVAIVKQSALLRRFSKNDNFMGRREECLNLLEDMKGKRLEEQYCAMVKALGGMVRFCVEELVVSSSTSGDVNEAVTGMMERAASLLRDTEETIYLVKSWQWYYGRSRARARRWKTDKTKDKKTTAILHGAFRDSQEAYSFALALQVQEILQHATDLADKEPIRAMLARLSGAEDRKEEAFASLQSWIMEERVHLTCSTRNVSVQNFVVKNVFEEDYDDMWEEMKEQFTNWEEQVKVKESVNSRSSVSVGKG